MGEHKRQKEQSPYGPRRTRCTMCGGRIRDVSYLARAELDMAKREEIGTGKLICEACFTSSPTGPCSACAFVEAGLCGHPAADGDREVDIDSTCQAWQARDGLESAT